ncbi:hypothetical protein [Planotetraspora sp. GP83]|uniref:hypothetical protein n=1 Tax=Planotetraspora sp. GP83 TaxID=3156264 RepID=UPI003512D48C
MRWTDTAPADVSPSSRLLAAQCPGKAALACVVETASGRRLARFPLPSKGGLWGWFNEDHLLVFDKGPTPWQVRIVDLTGRTARPFADFTGTDDTYWLVHITTR